MLLRLSSGWQVVWNERAAVAWVERAAHEPRCDVGGHAPRLGKALQPYGPDKH